MATSVKYNGTTISPTPFVSRNLNPYDIGQRWGYSESVRLDGVVTGAQATGKIGQLTSIFSQSFKPLVVESNGDTSYMSIPNCVLENISIGENQFGLEATIAIPYSISLKSYHYSSGVRNVSHSYSFNEGRDGIVSVTKSIKAQGQRDGNDPIDNAYDFVSALTGLNPLTYCSPAFNLTGNPILLSISEQVDRTEGSYEVTENWSYETGSPFPYTTASSLSVSRGINEEYPKLDLSIQFKGPVNGNISTLRDSVAGYDYYSKLAQYGIQSAGCFLESFSVSEVEPNSISSSVNFVSGLAAEFTTGVFKHDISLDWDEIEDRKSYSINSEFVIKGSPEHRAAQIAAQKSNIVSNYSHYVAYMYHVVKGSELHNRMQGSRPLNPYPQSFSLKEGQTEPSLSLSASFNDEDFSTVTTENLPNGLTYPISIGKTSYKIDFEPSCWIIQIGSSANIEGHYLVQDLNCKKRDKFIVNTSTEHLNQSFESGVNVYSTLALSRLSAITSGVADSISANKYLNHENLNSGMHSYSIQREYYNRDEVNPALTANKFYGFLAGTYNTRDAGNKYGF